MAQRKKTATRGASANKSAKQRANDQFPKIPSSVSRKDFAKVKPLKLVPGVMGRTEWFQTRAGARGDSASRERLRRALQGARQLERTPRIKEQFIDDALHRILHSKVKPAAGAGAHLLDGTGRRYAVPAKAERKRTRGWSEASPTLEVRRLATREATLVIPVDERTRQQLDLDDVVLADVSDPTNPRLTEQVAYLAQQGVLVARIERAGVYRAYALPRHPWIRASFRVLCWYWKWVRFDALLRDVSGIEKGKLGPPLVDRICQLILCAPEYRRIGDPQVFDRLGLGTPPGLGDDLPPLGGGGNVCDHCLGDFLGHLEIDPRLQLVVPHPLIKWCWIKRPRCTRWVSVGPYPDATFQGIGRVTQLAIHPTNGSTLIAGAAGGGVWRTDNGGASWYPRMELEPTQTMGAVAIAPSNPQVMYAASGEDAGGWNPAWSGVGVYRSTSGGADWDLMTNLPSTRFSAIVVDPTDANTIYVAGNSGLHKSTDGGTTWLTNPGLGSLFDGQVTDVVLAHDDPQRLYIGVSNDGVYRSTTAGIGAAAFARLDGAAQLPSGAAAGWIKLAIGRGGSHGSDFLVTKLGADGSRIFTTSDAGTNWTELAANVASVSYDEWCSLIAVDPGDERVMYAGAAGALKRTTNGGATAADWTSIATGVHSDQQDLVFDPTNSRHIYLANDGGVYLSSDRGTNWTFMSNQLRITQFYDIDIAERDRDVIGGGAQDNGVYYRNAAGTWIHIPWGDGTQLAIDATDPSIFYFSSQNGLPGNLRRSVDGGSSHQALGTTGLSGGSPWVTIIKLDPSDPIVDPANNRIVFVCGTNELFRSTDGGQNWQRVEDAAGVAFQSNGTINALEFAPSNPSILYLATTSGAVYRGVNGGASSADWTRIDTPGSPADALFPNVAVMSIGVHATNPNVVWLVFGGAGVSYSGRPNMILNPLGISHVFRTQDGGANWQDASGRFASLSLPDIPTCGVALDDVNDEVAYVGTDVGVFRTTDGGETWAAFQDGLPRVPVMELRLNRRHNRLFAGTMGRGAYYRDV